MTKEEDVFSCSLTGLDFVCSSESRVVELEEVDLQIDPSAEGSFSSASEGQVVITELWSCISGSCSTYGLSDCKQTLNGQLGLTKAP